MAAGTWPYEGREGFGKAAAMFRTYMWHGGFRPGGRSAPPAARKHLSTLSDEEVEFVDAATAWGCDDVDGLEEAGMVTCFRGVVARCSGATRRWVECVEYAVFELGWQPELGRRYSGMVEKLREAHRVVDGRDRTAGGVESWSANARKELWGRFVEEGFVRGPRPSVRGYQ
jgi:hypothetical protein